MGLIERIVENGRKIDKTAFVFYLLSGEENIVYCYFKKDISADTSFGGELSSELIRFIETNKDFAAQSFIFDFSIMGNAILQSFFNDFKSILNLFNDFSQKRVDVVVMSGPMRNRLNEEFKKNHLKTGRKFFAVRSFGGGMDELTRLEKMVYVPYDESEEWKNDNLGTSLCTKKEDTV